MHQRRAARRFCFRSTVTTATTSYRCRSADLLTETQATVSSRPSPFPVFAYSPAMKILLIEDDREAAEYLQKALSEAGHNAHVAHDGDTGYQLALEGSYDVLVVDRMLPQRDGLSVISGLRAKDIKTPVLILSALGEVDDRVTGLRAGGDDYLTKPYAFTELLARVEVLERRGSPREVETVYRVGDLE